MQVAPKPDGDSLLSRLRRWVLAHPRWAVALVVVGILCLFLPKPFNVDDPLFLWSAHQIQAHPFDPYGFSLNWYGNLEPMWRITENPPLTCYYLALATKIVGWGEIGLHLAFILPALLAIAGTYRLATRLGAGGALPALITLVAPGFLVSSTTIMCDVMMLAFWIWAVVFWIEGMDRKRLSLLFLAMLLAGLATMTKFFGACLVPLLLAHGVFCKNRPKFWLLPFCIPILILGFYEAATRSLYGHGLFSLAAEYSAAAKKFSGLTPLPSAGIGLAFTGGCVLVIVTFAPWLWSKWALAVLAACAIIFGGGLVANGALLDRYDLTGGPRFAVAVQFIIWIFGGFSALALAARDWFSRRDAASLLLFLWVGGTFFFTAFLNWAVNVRSILPLVPAVALLIGRHLERKFSGQRKWPAGVVVALSMSAVLGMFIARADFIYAVTVRNCAWLVCEKFGTERGRLEFEGHWGFQYYAEAGGARPAEIKPLHPVAGGYLAIPVNNYGIDGPDETQARVVSSFAVAGPRWLATWNKGAGAGFNASTCGPLPFAFNDVPPEPVVVYMWNNSPAVGAGK